MMNCYTGNNNTYNLTARDNTLFCEISFAKNIIHHFKKPSISHFHTNAEIILIEEGKGNIYMKNKVVDVEPNDIVIFRSMEPHLFSSDSNEYPMSAITLSFSPWKMKSIASEWIDPILNNMFFSSIEGFTNRLDKNNVYINEMVNLIYEIKSEIIKIHPNPLIAKTKFLTALARLSDVIDYRKMFDFEISGKYISLISNSIGYINKHLTEDITLEDLAHNANMEISHFSSVFKTVQGLSPWNYVLHARVELAMRYLKDAKNYFSVTEVAGMSGFNNLSNFNRTFKNITGVTPSEYRVLD